ncbi:MAG: Eco57I restriction-modification methylase domain-containing protein [Ruminococcus sp.]|nr:Eco57I restriction-modification methylase domain-containing protein [Ruminococcus sp.]
MKFDFVIGNPPYQDETLGENKGFAPPIYNVFMEETYKVADVVELITPARFLFNAGSTPKDWNKKMLSDTHLKVIDYHADCKEVFPNQDIKGGVAITLRDNRKEFGAIGAFTAFPELNSIMNKVKPVNDSDCLTVVISTQNRFNLDMLYSEHPEFKSIIGSNGKDKRFRNNIFDKIPEFTEERRNNDDVAVFGLIKNRRVWRYLPRKYFDYEHPNFSKWKVLVPRANGSGALGEVLSNPLVGKPFIGYTQTFIGIGAFDTEFEANAMLKYIKSKFARIMLGILKITQDNDKEVWRFVPLQDFTPNSDIDWSKPIPEIDQQLYKKYGLTPDEIKFIETHVKEME